VVSRLGLAAFHGPLVAAELARGLSADEEASFLGALAGRYPAVVPLGAPLRSGPEEVSGPLLGGCLSLLTATLGTPFAADLSGSLLFWEDVAEPAYRIDRMLTHLRLSGSLDTIRGMIVGHITAAGAAGPAGAGDVEAARVDWPQGVGEALAGFSWPLAWGLPSGHAAPNRTLPLGLTARLPADAAQLVLGEG